MTMAKLRGFTLLCWDGTLDGIASNVVDLQKDPRIVALTSAKPGLNDMAKRLLGKTKDGKYTDYSGRINITRKDLNYAVQDAILCYEINEVIKTEPLKIIRDTKMMRIGRVNVKAPKEYIEDQRATLGWCSKGNNQAASLDQAISKASRWAGKDLVAIDTGEGKMSECAASVCATWAISTKIDPSGKTLNLDYINN
jgi:hypothetical protein